jgi:hypothetical protein
MHERSRERRLARQHGSLVPLAALSGILALLAAERQEREGRRPYAAERILARAGLSDDQIATVTGHEASEVPASIENDTTVVSPAREQPVIDRARAALLAHRASKS